MLVRQFIAAVAGLTAFIFLASWAGLGNGPNPPIGQFWGDPISFDDAVGKLPRILLAVAITVVIVTVLGGIRTGGNTRE